MYLNASSCEVMCTLLDVPELRVPVAQLVYLLLGAALESVVTLPGCSELVLVDAVQDAKYRKEQDHDLSSEVDGVAGAIGWAV